MISIKKFPKKTITLTPNPTFFLYQNPKKNIASQFYFKNCDYWTLCSLIKPRFSYNFSPFFVNSPAVYSSIKALNLLLSLGLSASSACSPSALESESELCPLSFNSTLVSNKC